MTDVQLRHPTPAPRGERERQGSLVWLLILAIGLVGAAVTLSTLDRDAAEPFVFALLALFSVIGVVALFGAAVGVIGFGERDHNSTMAGEIIAALDEGVVVTGSDERVIYANETYMAMSGSDGRSVASTVPRAFAAHPDANEPIFRLAQAAREGRRWQEEFRVGSDVEEGEGRWYRVSVQPVDFAADGTPAKSSRSIWRVADMTEERQRQENIFQELQNAIDYLDHAPAGFFSTNADGHIQYMNATLAGWLGLDLTQTVAGAVQLRDIVAGQSSALLDQAVPVAGEARTEVLDLDLKRRDGTPLPVRLLHSVSFTADGSPGYSRTLVINRSPGEDVSETLRAAEVRFARFFNNAPIAIATVEAGGAIVRANAAFARMRFGAKADKAARGNLIDLVTSEDKEAVAAALKVAAAGQSDIEPFNVTFAGEAPRAARIFLSPATDLDRKSAAIVYGIDTSAQRALEAQFAQSQKMQAVGQLAGGVAHDFNNVLTAIIGYSDLLLASHRPTDPAFQDIMNIKHSANRAAGLVRQLLAFSRRQTLRPEVLRLNDAISEFTVMLRRLLGEKVALILKHPPDLWLVKVDQIQLEQVIINLAVNARDAMSDGGKLTIRTANVAAEEAAAYRFTGMPAAEYVLIEVSDTGAGMTPEVMEKVFEPFFSTKDVGKGTGLGLSTVYGIIKQTGGFIYPKSKPGQGTSFMIFLPRHLAADPAERAARAGETKEAREGREAKEAKAAREAKEAREAPADLTGRGRVLLVEDEDAVRTFAARALTSRGYSVFEAASGAEALEVMGKQNDGIDLVVSDVVMPEMDGPSLLKELRKRSAHVKIIFMSGYAEEAFKKNLEGDENFHFLQKPFNLKELAAMVKEVMEE
ncbi:MAG: response regulator [Hyphomicrobiales bacterium]|nr:response regulator [Hyphomicrobiales bacterium]